MKPRLALAIAIIPLLAAGGVSAQSSDDRLRDQLRQVTLQLRQLQDDQATLQAQKAAAEQERDALKKQLADAQAELGRARRNGERVDVMQQDLAKTKTALSQASDQAQQSQAERDKLQDTVAKTHVLLDACQAKNAQLLKVGNEILKAYEKFDVVDAVGANEPFLRLERVQLENLAQDYQDRLDDGRYDPRTVRAPAPAPTTGSDKP